MRKLTRLKGYTERQVKRFNEIRESIDHYEFQLSEGEDPAPLEYSADEIQQLNAYEVLAHVDYLRREAIMNTKRSVDDYTAAEIAHLDYMQGVLEEFNKLLGEDDMDIKLIIPQFGDIDMIELSQYRQLWIERECQD